MRRDESGQTLVVIVLFAGIVLLGLLAMALDVGYLFHEKRMAQAAAASAAAEEYTYNNSLGAASTNAAYAAAAANGFDHNAAVNPASVNVSISSSGNYSNTSTSAPTTWTVVQVSRPIQTFFLGAFIKSLRTMTVSATASAAGGQSSPTCVCLEGTSGTDLSISGGSKLTASSCGIVTDSNSSSPITVSGGSTLCAESISAQSAWDNSTNINNGSSICSSADIVQSSAFSCAPAMPVVPAADYASCVGDPTGGGSWGATGKYVLGPSSSTNSICYTSLVVGGNGATVTLNPGVYVINGGQLHFESGANGHSNLGGNGVFFYLVNGASVVFDNGANVNLVAGGNTQSSGSTAPDVGPSGTYNHVVIYQDTSDTKAIDFEGGSATYFNGGIYAPGAALTLGNGSTSTVKTDVVAKTMSITGGVSFTAYPVSNLGTMNTTVTTLSQ
jgi:Flp pilus assembly protein TadG